MALYVWNLYVALTRAHLLLHINITYVVFFLPVALARANLLVDGTWYVAMIMCLTKEVP